MKKFLIFKKNVDDNGKISFGRFMGSYESEVKDDSSANRSYLAAEPNASHFELPEGMDEDCAEPTETSVEGIFELQEKQEKVIAKKQAKADENLRMIRSERDKLLVKADHAINTLEDEGQDASALKSYRKELRNCTDSLKDEDGNAKIECADLDPSQFQFPEKL